MKKKSNRLYSFLWTVATIIEWVNIVLFVAAMGYEIDIPIYMKIREYRDIATIYYIVAAVDIMLFGLLMMVERSKNNVKNMLLALYCALAQIALLIYKIKL